jgi:ABC-type transporter Mla maintaining outer membrane lipid asymmetry ATPase subunit MlaF
MIPIDGAAMRDVLTTFLILKDGKVIFDGTGPELVANHDPYIREYIS